MKTLKDLLNVAIKQEVDSQKLYRKGIELVQDEKTKNFLKRLADEEVKHENILYNIRETGIYNPDTPINDQSLFDEAQSSHSADEVEFKQNLTVEDILEIALKREFDAGKVFKAAANAVEDNELKILLNNLAQEEIDHHREVEKQYKLLRGAMGNELG